MSNSAELPSLEQNFSVVSKADDNSTESSDTTTTVVSPPPPDDGSTSPSSGDGGSDSGSKASPPANNKTNNETSNGSPSPPPPSGSNSSNNQGSADAPDDSGTPPPPPPSSSSSKTPSTTKSPPASQNSGSNSPTPSPPPPPSNSGNQSPPSSTGQPSPQSGGKSPPQPSTGKPNNPQTPSGDGSPPAPRTQTATPTPSGTPSVPLSSGGFNPPPAIGSPPGQGGSETSPTRGNVPSSASSASQDGSIDSASNSKATGNSGNSGNGNGNSATTAIIVASTVVVSVILIALIAVIIATRKKKRRHDPPYAPPYMTPPNNFSAMQQSDPYYYGQAGGPHSMGYSSQNHSYASQQNSGAFSGGSQRGMSSGPDSGLIGGGKSFFSYEEVMEMTRGFSRENIIGEGGFGCVFKGWQPDGKMVAVKQLKAGSGQGDREFKAEVEIISRVHHRHLVSLVGYSMSDAQRLLIYEFLPNNTLEYHLHAKGPGLDWSQRLKIAIGAAKGLAYLHEDCNPKIIHRDIKSANILLGSDFEAQANFGLARLNDTTQTHVSTRVMGTFGYLAPEYAQSGKLTDRSDVYSFGVVLLELITGRKPVDSSRPLGDESLVEWARPHLMHAMETGDLGELVDPRLEKRYVEAEMMRMIETAAACIRHSAPKRPRMMQVVRALDSDETGDLTNGMKYGQSTMYNSGQYNEEIMKFRRMALGSDDSGEFGYSTGDFTTREMSHGVPIANSTGDYSSSGELETRAINRPSSRNW
ncbi:unnamed protein product [Linum tenue]|uniref:non-specific serine/threonine protein kinase n=1 Tax=Linum tenue TaxID=586396 RepID=A0AAV0HMJ3_9ROSI|nr:unnamed protein product [Linum tenue]